MAQPRRRRRRRKKEEQQKGPKFSLRKMVDRQIDEVLRRGQRYDAFDQIRQRHFWSTFLFAYGDGPIESGAVDIFKVIPGGVGQGYPTNVPLTLRETNWRNVGRVPDNQNFVITELGCTVMRPSAQSPNGPDIPLNSIFANLPPTVQAAVNPLLPINPDDAARILYGMVLEMSFLTNNVPLGWCSDFSQSGGIHAFDPQLDTEYPGPGSPGQPTEDNQLGDPVNGTPAAAFRRKLEVPILLQHGETMGMRLNVHRPITLRNNLQGGAGWAEVRVDWWATESFVEYS